MSWWRQVPTRRYPDAMAAHLFGYVGEVNDAQVAESGTLKSGDIVGQSGVEKIYNALLMGTDGVKRVVVNSVGREIRTLEEDEPTEGKRLQLTIDIDVQKAVEDAFKATPFNGAAVVLDPKDGAVLAFASLPAYNPNAFAAGIDRATWAALERGRAASAERSRHPGPVFAWLDVQDGRGAGRARGGHHHAGLSRALRRPRELLRPRLQVLEEARPRLDGSAPRHRAVVRRVFLHRRQHGRHRQDQQVGDRARPRREERYRPAE